VSAYGCPRCGGAAYEHACLGCGRNTGDCTCTSPVLPAAAVANGSPLHYSAAEIADSASRADQLRGALLDSEALDSLPEPRWLVDGIVPCDSLVWLHGKPGHGKSFIALDWAGCVSAGLPWQMHGVTPGPVLYVIAEGVSGLRQRVRAWEDHARERIAVRFLPVAVQFRSALDLAAVIGLTRELQPVLIVIDTQARVTVGADENSSRDMGEFVAALSKLRQATHACILIVHHEARAGENMRGSTALEGAADTEIRITKDGPHLFLTNPKQKDAAEFDGMRLRLVPRLESATVQSHDGVGLAEELSASEQTILGTLRDLFGTDGASGSRLFEVAGLAKTSYYRALKGLVAAGVLVNIGNQKRTHYVLAEHAQSQQSHLVPTGSAEPRDS
jgi:hypothetical protein